MEFLVLEDKFVFEKRIFSCLWISDILHLFSLEERESEPFTFLKLLEEIIWGKSRLI